MKGIVIAAPFLIVLVWLLSSADLVFQAYLEKLFEIDINLEIISRALIILIVSYFFIGIFSKISKSHEMVAALISHGKGENLEVAKEKERENRFLGFIESSTILILVELLFLIFLYKKIFLEKKEAVFLFFIFCLTIVFWAAVNILNPDAFIAKKNIERAVQGGELDLRYLSRLSEDAVPEIAQIFDKDIDDAIKERAANNLYARYNPPYNLPCNMTGALKYENKCEFIPFQERLEKIRKTQKWQSFNLSNTKALSALEENYKEIVEYHTKFWAENKEQ